MVLGIDHLVIAVADPDRASADLERRVGLEASGGGRHEALGTFNRLVWLGDSYLELIGVFDPLLARRSWIGPPTVRALEAGGGLATWAMASDALDRDVADLRAIGADLGDPTGGERLRPDGTAVRWRLSTPRTLGPQDPPFFIEHDPGSAEWTSADRAARAKRHHPVGGPVRLEALELPVDDLNVTIQRFARSAGLQFRPSLAGGGARDAVAGGQTVRLRPRRAGSPGSDDPPDRRGPGRIRRRRSARLPVARSGGGPGRRDPPARLGVMFGDVVDSRSRHEAADARCADVRDCRSRRTGGGRASRSRV